MERWTQDQRAQLSLLPPALHSLPETPPRNQKYLGTPTNSASSTDRTHQKNTRTPCWASPGARASSCLLVGGGGGGVGDPPGFLSDSSSRWIEHAFDEHAFEHGHAPARMDIHASDCIVIRRTGPDRTGAPKRCAHLMAPCCRFVSGAPDLPGAVRKVPDVLCRQVADSFPICDTCSMRSTVRPTERAHHAQAQVSYRRSCDPPV